MRTTAFAIALLIGGAAVAQTTTVQTTTQPDVDVDADVGVQPDGDLDVDADVDLGTQTTTTTTTTTGTTAHGTTAHGTMTHTTTAAATTPASGPVVQPSNAAPERDARGIAVISDPAAVPAGWNGVSGTAMGGPMVDPASGETVAAAADASYPACTATVTDNCVQTYERGRPR